MTESENQTEALESEETTTEEEVSVPFWRRFWRIGLLVAVVGVVYAIAAATGFLDQLTLENIQATMISAGAWGVLLFVIAFAVGNLLQIPGNLFVAASVAVYGTVEGSFTAWLGALVAVSASFWFARLVGGQALEGIKKPFVKKLLARLEKSPVLVMVVLRIIFQVSPPLNYTLALSKIRYRDYLMGSALGLIGPIMVVALITDVLLNGCPLLGLSGA